MTRLTTLLLLLSPGCAALMHPKAAKYRGMVESFEHAQPTADLAADKKILANMDDWEGEIGSNPTAAGPDQKALLERLGHPRRHYRVATAKPAPQPGPA